MSALKKKKIDEKIKATHSLTDIKPALCRCCGSLTKFRVLNGNYYNSGRLEVYSDMIKNSFGFELSKLDGEPSERLICAPCMHRLRDACSFRLQVLETEQKFLQKHMALSGSKIRVKLMSEMKQANGGEDSDVPDGFDEELDPDQLKEYYELGGETEPHDADRCSSLGDDSAEESVDIQRQRRPKTQSMKSVMKRVSYDTLGIDDKSYIHNATSILRYSYACPFRNRFNHVLCAYCGEYYLHPEQLREHTLTHEYKDFKNTAKNRFIKIDITRIDCKLCPEKIDNLEDFKRHLVTVHKKRYFTNSKDGVIPFRLVQNVNACTLCGEDFQQFKGLVRHMDQHFSNYVCETCGMGFMDEKSLQKHLPAHDGKRYPCGECGHSFKSVYTLQGHVKRIHEKNEEKNECSDESDSEPLTKKKKVEEDVPCQGCDQTFKSRKHWAIHVRKVHMNYRHVCQVCGQKFFRRFALINHMPTHTGERNFKCKECGKTYPRLKTLKEHTRIHTNDRRYRCHLCAQAFIQNCSLKGHLKSKHPEYRSV